MAFEDVWEPCFHIPARAALKPMRLHWAPRHGAWAGYFIFARYSLHWRNQ